MIVFELSAFQSGTTLTSHKTGTALALEFGAMIVSVVQCFVVLFLCVLPRVFCSVQTRRLCTFRMNRKVLSP